MKLVFTSTLLFLCCSSPAAGQDVKKQSLVKNGLLRKEAGDRTLNTAEDDSESHRTNLHEPSAFALQAHEDFRAFHHTGPINLVEEVDDICKVNIKQTFFEKGGVTLANRQRYIQQFKPCGWFKEHCSDYKDAPVIQNNVNYSTRLDVDLEATYIVQFDIGMSHSAYNLMKSLTNWRQKELFEVDPDKKWEKITVDQWQTFRYQGVDGVKDGFPEPPTVGNGAALGEVCVEIPSKFYDDLGDIMGNIPTYDLGGCGEDDGKLAQIYWGKTCMQHDLCTVFKAVIQGNDHTQGVFCDDIDCGDEAMATVTDCEKDNWGPDWLVGEHVDCPDRETTDIYPYIGRATQVIDSIGNYFNIDTCYFWTGYETGGSTPAMAFKNGHSCSYDIECFSGNCPWGWKWVCKD